MALSTDQTNHNFVGAGDVIDGKWLSELLLRSIGPATLYLISHFGTRTLKTNVSMRWVNWNMTDQGALRQLEAKLRFYFVCEAREAGRNATELDLCAEHDQRLIESGQLSRLA